MAPSPCMLTPTCIMENWQITAFNLTNWTLTQLSSLMNFLFCGFKLCTWTTQKEFCLEASKLFAKNVWLFRERNFSGLGRCRAKPEFSLSLKSKKFMTFKDLSFRFQKKTKVLRSRKFPSFQLSRCKRLTQVYTHLSHEIVFHVWLPPLVCLRRFDHPTRTSQKIPAFCRRNWISSEEKGNRSWMNALLVYFWRGVLMWSFPAREKLVKTFPFNWERKLKRKLNFFASFVKENLSEWAGKVLSLTRDSLILLLSGMI